MSGYGNNYRGLIPANMVTSYGVDYYIVATDTFGNMAQLPLSGIFSVQIRLNGEGEVRRDAQGSPVPQQNGSEQTAYRLISVPLALDNKNPKAVLEDDLGPYNIKKWRFYELQADQTNQPYVEFPNTSEMMPGKAFWLIIKEAGKIIDTGPGISNQTDKEYAIALYPKWNFVGNPFNFRIPLQNIRFKSRQNVELRSFTGVWNNPVNVKVDGMEPFEGYAVHNDSSFVDTLFINPNLSSSQSPLLKEAALNRENILWFIGIQAQCQEARDVDNIAAVASAASNYRDEIDQPEPPVIGEYVSVYFPHPEWEKVVSRYCTDARPQPSDGEVWEFEATTNIRDHVNLIFKGLETVPENFEVWLVDAALKISQNLREKNQYTVVGLVENHPKRLKLVVGNHDFVLEKQIEFQTIPSFYELSQNFPNPFNPSTTIRYGLPKAERVTLKVYNLLGEEVAALVNDEQRTAGYHVAIWDGRNKDGSIVASGVYVYRLRAGSITITKKMAMVK